MILKEIQNYFLEVQTASLSHLAAHFNVNETVLQDMLAFWIKKGKLKKVMSNIEARAGANTKCATCPLSCMSAQVNSPCNTVYEWVV